MPASIPPPPPPPPPPGMAPALRTTTAAVAAASGTRPAALTTPARRTASGNSGNPSVRAHRGPFALFLRVAFPGLSEQERAATFYNNAVKIPVETVRGLAIILWVHLRDGTVRVKAGQSLRLPNTGGASAQVWEDWAEPFLERLSSRDDQRPDRPPELAPGRAWFFIGPGDAGDCVERRQSILSEPKNSVVVIREGLSMPTSTLVDLVNSAHAVLVLRGSNGYYYLRDDFVLSTDEEESLVEWGVGRPLFANSCLAVGGTLLVAYAEQIWRPAVVGTLLVAAAGYRIRGALTKVLRVSSVRWQQTQLVPSRIHGAERVVQLVTVTLVALADLLDDRVLLLTALIYASVHVVLMESVGQAVTTWGFQRYTSILFVQLRVWTFICIGGMALVWSLYLFAGAVSCCVFGCFGIFFMLTCCTCTRWYDDDTDEFDDWLGYVSGLFLLGLLALTCWFGVMDWGEADLKFSLQSLKPWRWPLFRAPDSFSTGLRIFGLWFAAILGYLIAAYAVVGLLSFRISSDRVLFNPRGERTLARKRNGVFGHYHVSSIPSRNLLVPYVGQPAPSI